MQLCCVTTHDLLVERKEQSRPESALTLCINFIAMAVGRCMKACFTAQPLAACHCREHICSTAGQQRIHIRLTLAVLTKGFAKKLLLAMPSCQCRARASLGTRQLRPFLLARHTLPCHLLSQIQAPLMNALCCINDSALTHAPGHLFAHTALLSHHRPHSPSSGPGCLLYAVSSSETCAWLFAASADLHKDKAIDTPREHAMAYCGTVRQLLSLSDQSGLQRMLHLMHTLEREQSPRGPCSGAQCAGACD